MSVSLKRFTSFDYAVGIGYLEVWIQPGNVAYVQPRRRSLGDSHVLDGTRIYFQQEAGVLDVKEPIGAVVALLGSGNGSICRDCYEPLSESWRHLCEACRAHHNGIHVDPEEAVAS
jgi:hypothetical protein